MEPLFVLLTFLVVLSSLAPTRRRAKVGLLDLFGSGFLAYRDDGGWPHGMQEEEPPSWTWDHPDEASSLALGDAASTAPADGLPELRRARRAVGDPTAADEPDRPGPPRLTRLEPRGQAGVATQVGSSRSSVASGSEPWPRTWSWNSRRSKSAPSRALICRRSCSMTRWPSL